MQAIIFALCLLGAYCLATARWPSAYHPAAMALRKRAPKTLTQMELAVAAIAAKIEPSIDIDPIKAVKLSETLKSLGTDETPASFQAKALAKSAIISLALTPLLLVSVPLGLGLIAVICASLYKSETQKLAKGMEERRQMIERELPQFASTVRQSLNSTHDVATILASYGKICGPALKGEIGRTLNDMITGSPERAIKSLESRVSSAKLSQLTRGLIATLRGDDQRVYFDMLSNEYRKAQNEAVAKALLKRPEKLLPYMGALFGCLCLMIAASLGVYLVEQMGQLF